MNSNDSAGSTTMDEAELHHPWGTVTPAFWAGPDTGPPAPTAGEHDVPTTAETPAAEPEGESETEHVPLDNLLDPAGPDGGDEDLDENGGDLDVTARVAEIQAAAAVGQLPRAQVLAEDLDTAVTAAYGAVHLDTIQVREIRGYLAHLTGHPTTGLDWYLHTLELRSDLHGPDSPETDAAARRAYGLWRALAPADAQETAPRLLAAVTRTQGPDAPTARWTRRRSAELAAAPNVSMSA